MNNKLLILFYLIAIYGGASLLPQDVRIIWVYGVSMGAVLTLLFRDKTNKTAVSLSCAPTTTFHTFKNDEAWSCDCGHVQRREFQTPNSNP